MNACPERFDASAEDIVAVTLLDQDALAAGGKNAGRTIDVSAEDLGVIGLLAAVGRNLQARGAAANQWIDDLV